MNYVIYGAGYRGRGVSNYIGFDNVAAFIDTDKDKQGKKYFGKPVISIEEYINKYFMHYIIITPICIDNIEVELEWRGIYQYSNLINMPSEFLGYGNYTFELDYRNLKHSSTEYCCIYGINAFSLLLYDFLCKDKKISVCPEIECKQEKIEWLKKYYPNITIKEYSNIKDNEMILMSDVGEIGKKYPNTILDLFEYANKNYYQNEELLKVKNIYKEKKKCFIVATGPSLRIEDLHTLKKNNIICFGVNSIIKVSKEWTSNVYVATDSQFVNDNMTEIANYGCDMKFISDACEEYWREYCENSYKIHCAVTRIGTGFSEKIGQKVYSGYKGGGTVTYVCLQLAVYMGFTEIYLLGTDCNYIIGSSNNHFIKDDVVDNKNHGTELMIKAYECARDYANAHNIKIYNATRGGMLEVFERVNFDSLFEERKSE
ncbi:MAG: DUF115 domain-containing protein [Lachnospiraceae bacterium]|nr:DUF115 domain-containing protein [Lachnospiraceae bacterium]